MTAGEIVTLLAAALSSSALTGVVVKALNIFERKLANDRIDARWERDRKEREAQANKVSRALEAQAKQVSGALEAQAAKVTTHGGEVLAELEKNTEITQKTAKVNESALTEANGTNAKIASLSAAIANMMEALVRIHERLDAHDRAARGGE